MRDCFFLVADSNMAASFTGFLERDRFHDSLGIRPFLFDPEEDMVVDGGHDPGVYQQAHAILRPIQNSYRHAIIALDEEWDGSPGADVIRQDICANMHRCGWSPERFEVIVIVPELEVWICQDSPHVAQAFRFTKHTSIRQWLSGQQLWPADQPKPPSPKEAIDQIRGQTPRSSAIYKRICSKISVRHCVDPAFQQLRGRLQEWFPPGGTQ